MFTEKNEGKKSRDTIPLMSSSPLMEHHYPIMVCPVSDLPVHSPPMLGSLYFSLSFQPLSPQHLDLAALKHIRSYSFWTMSSPHPSGHPGLFFFKQPV